MPPEHRLDAFTARVLKCALREHNAEKVVLADDMRERAVETRTRINHIRTRHAAQRARLASRIEHARLVSNSVH